jgi:ABC-type hemin transport system ATPase subunit
VTDPKNKAPTASREAEADAESSSLPAIDFSTFVLSLSHSALVHLGDAPMPDGEPAERDLQLARQTIDLLGVLQEKTKNNLSGEEERRLDQALYDLRIRFVEISKTT